jgi:chromosomal replication initiation ATPase DnaA
MIADFDLLVEETALTFKVDREDILGPTRTKTASLARHVVMAAWADYHSYQDAAERCNRLSHATAMWARERVLNMAGIDQSFAMMIAEIYRKCQYGSEERTEPEAVEPENESKYLEIYA